MENRYTWKTSIPEVWQPSPQAIWLASFWRRIDDERQDALYQRLISVAQESAVKVEVATGNVLTITGVLANVLGFLNRSRLLQSIRQLDYDYDRLSREDSLPWNLDPHWFGRPLTLTAPADSSSDFVGPQFAAGLGVRPYCQPLAQTRAARYERYKAPAS